MNVLPPECELLRIFIGESDRHQGKPLYEAIVAEAKKSGVAGATVLRGLMGFGAQPHAYGQDSAPVGRLADRDRDR